MNTENLSTLKIHKLTQAQYERELAAGRIDENALYLTPDEEVDMSIYATKEDLNEKANNEHSHKINDIKDIQSSFDRVLDEAKAYADSVSADADHNHDDRYYTEAEINAMVDAANDSINSKADAGHTHEGLYYTMDDVDQQILLKAANIIAEHDQGADAHANVGWLTGEDVAIDSPVPIDADTLGGHNVNYFATKKQVADIQSTLSGFVTEDDLTNAIGNVDLSTKQDKITGNVGDFVVIGADGKVTTKTIPSAEGVAF